MPVRKQAQKSIPEGSGKYVGPLFIYPLRVAFAGYSRAGKDIACEPFYNAGYERWSYGDLIKEELDFRVKRDYGFSAFTEIDEEKDQIRVLLEDYGREHETRLLARFDAEMPRRAIYPRLFNASQARNWKEKHGGLLIEVRREGLTPKTPYEEKCIAELRDGGWIDGEIFNPYPMRKVANPGPYRAQFHDLIRDVFGLPPVGKALADLYARQPGVEAAWVIK